MLHLGQIVVLMDGSFLSEYRIDFRYRDHVRSLLRCMCSQAEQIPVRVIGGFFGDDFGGPMVGD